jgi:predicted HicB family RNase H-like nuclease
MKDYFEYKGYLGSAEVDTEGNVLVGKLLFIRDVIAYSAKTPAGLVKAFHAAVDDYLQTCAELGDEPDTPCKGTFNVRIGPALHREAAVVARSKGMSLNEFVCEALKAASQTQARQQIEHVHKHEHQHKLLVTTEKQTQYLVTSGTTSILEQSYATQH